jgi:competence protein ComEA
MKNRNENRSALLMRALIHIIVLLGVVPLPLGRALAQEATPQATVTSPGVVNVNTASEEELMRLPGVGPAKAQAFLEARARRPFRRLSDLMRVSGIGRRTLERLAPMIAFEGPTTLASRRR